MRKYKQVVHYHQLHQSVVMIAINVILTINTFVAVTMRHHIHE